jgi:hypothetical protein
MGSKHQDCDQDQPSQVSFKGLSSSHTVPSNMLIQPWELSKVHRPTL